MPNCLGGAEDRREEPRPVLQPGGGGHRAEAARGGAPVPQHCPPP